jgi:zinc-ribbon domain
MYCSHCGATVAESALSCASCGSKVSSNQQASEQVYDAPPQSQQQTARPTEYSANNAQRVAPQSSAPTASPAYYQQPHVHVTQQVQVASPVLVRPLKSVGPGGLTSPATATPMRKAIP